MSPVKIAVSWERAVDVIPSTGEKGTAMGNASDKIKAEAHQVCGSVTRDGVYHYCVEQGLIPPKAF